MPLRLLAALTLLLFALPARAVDIVPVEQPTLHEFESEIVRLTNVERAKHGLPALAVDQSLVVTSRQHTRWMLRHGMIHSHCGVPENICMGYRTPTDIVTAWIVSPGHHANMLRRAKWIGVSGYVSPSGTVYATQQFR